MTQPRDRKRVALAIAHGPEVRAFIYSGLARRLAEHHEVVVLVPRQHSKAFEGLGGIRVLPMPFVAETRLLSEWRSLAHNAQLGWLRSRGHKNWAHYINLPSASRKRRAFRRLATALGQVPAVAPLLRAMERGLGHALGTHPVWRQLLGELKIDCLITASFASSPAQPALQTAVNLGLKTIVVTNSWKDVYTTTNVAVVPTRLLVWSRRAATDLLAMNPHVDPRRVSVSESLHLEPFLRPAAVMKRSELCNRLGLDPARPYLCYSAAAPAAVLNEENIIGFLLDAIRRGDIPGRPQLLVRLNPMEDGRRFQPKENLIIQKPDWEWDPAADWCCALLDDVALWVATAHHAALNISIPSTVTREFSAAGRPVVNVCFDLPEPLPAAQSNRRFWDGSFYAEIRELGQAAPAFSPEELVAQINQAQNTPAGQRPETVAGPVDSVLAVVEEVLVS